MMLTGLVQNLRLRAEARTGLSGAVVVFALIAAIAVVAAFVFFVFAAFIWLAERYSPLTAALIVAVAFVLIAIICAIGAVMAQRHTSERAKRALAVRSQSPWFDPATLGIALQLGRSIGLRRIAPLAAAGVLAAALAKEWFRDRPDDSDEIKDEEAA
jgi:ABC-type transport system involved in multi-copper enzyme maturation permease subunit